MTRHTVGISAKSIVSLLPWSESQISPRRHAPWYRAPRAGANCDAVSKDLPNSRRSACAISQGTAKRPASAGSAAPSSSASFFLLPPSEASLAGSGGARRGEAMLAWKEKVADRLARLLADSPAAPAAAAAPVQTPQPQVRSAPSPLSLPGASHIALCRCELYPFCFPMFVWIRLLVRGSWDRAVAPSRPPSFP